MKYVSIALLEDVAHTLFSSIKKGLEGVLFGWTFQTHVLVTGFFFHHTSDDDDYFLSLLPGGIEICGTFGPNVTNAVKSKSREIHISVGSSKCLTCFQLDEPPISVDEVSMNKAIQILAERLALFQIRGLIEVKVHTQKGKLVFKVDQGLSNEILFMITSQSIPLLPSTVSNKLLDDLIPTKNEPRKVGVSLFERVFHPHDVKMSMCISSLEPQTCVAVKRSSLRNGVLSIPILIDALCFVNFKSTLLHISSQLESTVLRQLYLFKKIIVDGYNAAYELEAVPFPEFHHFMFPGCCHPITVCYPRNASDEKLTTYRRDFLHQNLALSSDKPIFRRPQHRFHASIDLNSPLICTHLLVKPPKMLHSKIHAVDGLYSYYHYKQDNVDDEGWGCAYRSLQTIVSWLKFQGYTSKPIPTHDTIQELAVSTGERALSFIGSKQWLGAVELSSILNEYTGVKSKILFVNRGSEMGSIGRQLSLHFDTEGTPVMIGGGVLAHTIVGVSFSHVTGETQFLILDPHYIGPDTTDKIISRGGCSWKTVKFWNAVSFCNLCLPQRPFGC